MKKNHLKKLALFGIAGTLSVTCVGCGQTQTAKNGTSQTTEQKKLSAQDLVSKLDAETKAIYDSLDDEGKALALDLANQSCKGKNTCKGLNSCQGSDHSCSGLGGCAGTSPGPFKNKNDAVKIAAKHMADKRAGLTK